MFSRISFILLFCMGVFSSGFSDENFCENNPEYIHLTVPKSGSHLLGKLLRMFEELDKKVPSSVTGHLYHPGSPLGMYPQVKFHYKKLKKLILIRDPRDCIVSAVFWWSKYHSNIKAWMNLTFDQKIKTSILESMDPPFQFLSDSFRMLDVYLNAGPECCIVKFENLVGVNGGGSLEQQQDEIYKIADFLDIEITPFEMDFITENLHGLRQVDMISVQTFRKGIIGQWKQYFKPEHEQLFNEKFYPLLEIWGYTD